MTDSAEQLALREELDKATRRKEFWLRVAVLLMVLFIICSIAVIGYGVSAIRSTQLEGSPTQKLLVKQGEDTKQTLDVLLDCTTIGGDCYADGQKRTGEALSAIGEQFVFAIFCNHELPNGSVAQIRQCMADQTKKGQKSAN